MDTVHENGRRGSQELGQSSAGHMCYLVEQPITNFCLEHGMEGMDFYDFPPSMVLSRVLTIVVQQPCRATLFASLGGTTLVSTTCVTLVKEPVQ